MASRLKFTDVFISVFTNIFISKIKSSLKTKHLYLLRSTANPLSWSFSSEISGCDTQPRCPFPLSMRSATEDGVKSTHGRHDSPMLCGFLTVTSRVHVHFYVGTFCISAMQVESCWTHVESCWTRCLLQLQMYYPVG